MSSEPTKNDSEPIPTEENSQYEFVGIAVRVNDDDVVLDDGENVIRSNDTPEEFDPKLGQKYHVRGDKVDSHLMRIKEFKLLS